MLYIYYPQKSVFWDSAALVSPQSLLKMKHPGPIQDLWKQNLHFSQDVQVILMYQKV